MNGLLIKSKKCQHRHIKVEQYEDLSYLAKSLGNCQKLGDWLEDPSSNFREGMALLLSWSWTSGLQSYEAVNFCFKPFSLCYFVMYTGL